MGSYKNLTITFVDNSEHPSEINHFIVVINGQEFSNSFAFREQNQWKIFLHDDVAAEIIKGYPLNEIAQFVGQLGLQCKGAHPFVSWAQFDFSRAKLDSTAKIQLNCTPSVEDWANPYTISDYASALREATEQHPSSAKYFQDDDEMPFVGFGVEFSGRPMDLLIGEELPSLTSQASQLCDVADRLALKNVRKDSIVTFFEFPPAVKTACAQYLTYFIQFLEDLGVKADSEIKENAGRVLFSVTPKDGPSALGQIREALDAYLRLPRNPEFGSESAEFGGVAVSQLKANVFFLHSQLALAQAMIEAKDARIEALDLTVYQQRQLLTGVSVEKPASSSQDWDQDEPILGDTVHLTKYEGKIVKIDFPTILRRLKRSFGVAESKKIRKSQ
jgi:hypothetical protein